MVHADPFHSYCVALVVTSQPAIEEWAQKEGIEFNDFASLCNKDETQKEVLKSLQKVCEKLKLIKMNWQCI